MDGTFRQTNETGITMHQAIGTLLEKLWLVAAASVAGALLTLVFTLFFVTPRYESSVMFYVNNNSVSLGDASFSIDSGDISASKSLVNSYIVILDARESLEAVIEHAGVELRYEELKEMISASSVNSTEIFQVVVTSTDPEEAAQLAGAIGEVLPERIGSIIEGSTAKIVDSAVLPAKPSSPSYPVNTVIGFLLGFLLSVGAILLREIFNTEIRSREDLENCCSIPVLAAVPDMIAPPKKRGYYGYGAKQQSKAPRGKRPVVGGEISFAASEAYKLLRTMLEYSFVDEKPSRVIGITSALTGEGKSLTSVNLALNLAQMRKSVLLIDCDLRRPSIAAKLNMEKSPGLSGLLTGQHQLENLIRPCGIRGYENSFHVITSGKNPPNPVELLGSARMEKLLEALQDAYDYIILDLPPICEVSDALVVSRRTDGMLMVVREDYCTRGLLTEAMEKLRFVEARILGIAFNCTSSDSGSYGKKYYNRYGKSYSRAYSKVRSPYDPDHMPLDIPKVDL